MSCAGGTFSDFVRQLRSYAWFMDFHFTLKTATLKLKGKLHETISECSKPQMQTKETIVKTDKLVKY